MTVAAPGGSPVLNRSDQVVIGGGAAVAVLAGVAHYAGLPSLLTFLVSAVAMALVASLVGRSVEQLGDRFGAGATSVLQSALGNLPELFISIFALKAGLDEVVRAAIVGSVLANLLLVLGLAFVAGGLKHGVQKLGSHQARTITVLMLLSVSALAIPSVAHYLHTPARAHEKTFSVIVAVVLLVLFALSLPASLRKEKKVDGAPQDGPEEAHGEPPRWPVTLAVSLLAVAGVLAAFVSDWFVGALEPAMEGVGISNAFAGLVVVAIAGNAIENVVGIQLALKNQSAFAFAVILNSPVQIALVLAPVLVIISVVFGVGSLTLVFSPLLVVALILAVVLAAFISYDGESTWLEGAALIALYVVIATSFWWG